MNSNDIEGWIQAFDSNRPRRLEIPRRACVALILRLQRGNQERQGDSVNRHLPAHCLEVLFIRRAIKVRDRFSGHIGFPGGHQEDADNGDDLATAMRETREEVGLNLADSTCFVMLGRLDDQRIHSRSRVTAFCAFVFLQVSSDTPEVVQDAREVDSVWWIPIRALVDAPTDVTSIVRTVPIRFAWKAICAQVVFPSIRIAEMAQPDVSNHPDRTNPGTLPFLWGLTLRAFRQMILILAPDDHGPLAKSRLPIIPRNWFLWLYLQLRFRLLNSREDVGS